MFENWTGGVCPSEQTAEAWIHQSLKDPHADPTPYMQLHGHLCAKPSFSFWSIVNQGSQKIQGTG